MVATANIKKVQIKKFSVFIYSEAEPHAMYAIYKQTRKLCVLQYLFNISNIYETVLRDLFLETLPTTLLRIV